MRNTLFAILMFTVSLCNGQSDTTFYSSIEGITDKMLEILSGPKGETRDWETFRTLFSEGASMKVINSNAPVGRQLRTINIDEFITNFGPVYARDGFEEYAIGLEVDEFNGMANVFQSFYCKNLIGTYENKGINAYQMAFASERWWIVSSAFVNESEDSKIPSEYLFEK